MLRSCTQRWGSVVVCVGVRVARPGMAGVA